MSTLTGADLRTELARIVSTWTLIRTHAGDAYALIAGQGAAINVESRSFADALSTAFAVAHEGERPSEHGLRDGIASAGREARSSGLLRPVFTRVGSANGSVFLDLGDSTGSAVEITASGWEVTTSIPILFHRPETMRPLPVPSPDGDVSALKPFLPASEDAEYLFISWLTACLMPAGPYPILVLHGQQGSGKSFLAKIAKSILDPGMADLQMMPPDRRELMISARHAHILSFDNLSSIEKDMSDALCCLASGTGLTARRLYSNSELETFQSARPFILNGIDDLMRRGDLADRAIILDLPTFNDTARQAESALLAIFREAHASILGGLLNGAVAALRNSESVIMAQTPRMADFARWVAGSESAYGWDSGSALAYYIKNRGESSEAVIDADDLATWLIDTFSPSHPQWEGTSSELLSFLPVPRNRFWPETSSALGNRLNRIAPDLAKSGLIVSRRKSNGRLLLSVFKG